MKMRIVDARLERPEPVVEPVVWTERLRRVELDRAIGVVGGQVYPFDLAGPRQSVGTSTKGDHHVAIT